MGRPTHELVEALRSTAQRLRTGVPYRWTHQGACNCGHLAQTVTRLSKAELHRIALEKAGDWAEHAIDYCPDSGYPLDHVIEKILGLGLTTDDIVHLERLSDPAVVAAARLQGRDLDYRSRDDVVWYLECWSRLLNAKLVPQAPSPAPTARKPRPTKTPKAA